MWKVKIFFLQVKPILSIFHKWKVKWRVKRRKNCIVERENAFFKSSPVDKYHLPQINSEKVCFGCSGGLLVFAVNWVSFYVVNLTWSAVN
jgi:hypothetical protein